MSLPICVICCYQELDGDSKTFFRNVLQEIAQNSKDSQNPSTPAQVITDALKTLNELLGCRGLDDEAEVSDVISDASESLITLVDAYLKDEAKDKSGAVTQWILDHLNNPETRLVGAERAVNWFTSYLKDLEEQARIVLARLESDLTQLSRVILDALPEGTGKNPLRFNRSGKPTTQPARQLLEYSRLTLHTVILRGVCKLSQSIQSSISVVARRLKDLRGELTYLGDSFDRLDPSGQEGGDDETNSPDPLVRAATETLNERLPELTKQLDQEFHAAVIDEYGGLDVALLNNTDRRKLLADKLRNLARSKMREALKDLDVADMFADNDPQQTRKSLKDHLDAALPQLNKCGGSRRLLLVLPQEATDSPLPELVQRELDVAPSVVFDSVDDVTICYEFERISLPIVAAALVDNRPEYIEIASRLHSRTDVTWAKLVDVSANAR